jgi:hypothetical protein
VEYEEEVHQMKSLMVVGATLAALAISGGASAAPSTATVCPQDTQTFSGFATTLIVPAGGYCAITDATIARDLILQDGAGADLSQVTIGRDMTGGVDAGAGIFDTTIGHDLSLQGGDGGSDMAGVRIGHDYLLADGAGTHMERTDIGHDFVATAPSTVQTGKIAPDTPGGPVTVGHDVLISGSPPNPFVFDGICNLHVGHDMRVTNRSVTLGFGIASSGCAFIGQPGNAIGHDLVVTDNTAVLSRFGSSLRVGDNHVGHDLIFSGNTGNEPGTLIVTNNVVGHDALCSSNSQPVTVFSPNVASHLNTCG